MIRATIENDEPSPSIQTAETIVGSGCEIRKYSQPTEAYRHMRSKVKKSAETKKSRERVKRERSYPVVKRYRAFQDQVEEVLTKLAEGDIDDEIWAKVVVMEKCKRVAKAYLRHATVIVDGSEEEFDGKTIGFNHFVNSTRDEQTKEIRSKIKEGVILKMDSQGNIKGMARGAAPVICQGWKDIKYNCMSEKLAKLQGRLDNEEKVYKLFDMRRWKSAVERVVEGDGEVRCLLPRACVRIALAKEGNDMARTPCWIAIVNLVALDVLIRRLPNALSGGTRSCQMSIVKRSLPAPGSESSESSSVLTKATPLNVPPPPPPSEPPPPFAHSQIPEIVAAAVAQMNNNLTTQLLKADQLSQLANVLALSNQTNNADAKKNSPTRCTKKERRRLPPLKRSPETEESSGEDSALRSESSSSTEKSEKWTDQWELAAQSNDTLYQALKSSKEDRKETTLCPSTREGRGGRSRLHDLFFSSNRSITSDYDSNKDAFDSSSCSSTVSQTFKDYKEMSVMTKKLGTKELSHNVIGSDTSPVRATVTNSFVSSPGKPLLSFELHQHPPSFYKLSPHLQSNAVALYERAEAVEERISSRPPLKNRGMTSESLSEVRPFRTFFSHPQTTPAPSSTTSSYYSSTFCQCPLSKTNFLPSEVLQQREMGNSNRLKSSPSRLVASQASNYGRTQSTCSVEGTRSVGLFRGLFQRLHNNQQQPPLPGARPSTEQAVAPPLSTPHRLPRIALPLIRSRGHLGSHAHLTVPHTTAFYPPAVNSHPDPSRAYDARFPRTHSHRSLRSLSCPRRGLK